MPVSDHHSYKLPYSNAIRQNEQRKKNKCSNSNDCLSNCLFEPEEKQSSTVSRCENNCAMNEKANRGTQLT